MKICILTDGLGCKINWDSFDGLVGIFILFTGVLCLAGISYLDTQISMAGAGSLIGMYFSNLLVPKR